jgi:hypothetical protein
VKGKALQSLAERLSATDAKAEQLGGGVSSEMDVLARARLAPGLALPHSPEWASDRTSDRTSEQAHLQDKT